MNERIEKLAEQVDLLGDFTPTKVPGHYAGVIKIADIEKFAELIVKECISIADKESERFYNLDQEYCSMAMDNYRELIRLHFGVKE